MQTVRILADGSGWGHVGGWGWGMALSAGLVMFSIVALVVWAVVYSSPRSKNRSSEPDVYRLMFETNQPDTKAHPILDAQIDRNRQAVRTVAWEAVAAGRLAGDPVVLARLFWAALLARNAIWAILDRVTPFENPPEGGGGGFSALLRIEDQGKVPNGVG